MQHPVATFGDLPPDWADALRAEGIITTPLAPDGTPPPGVVGVIATTTVSRQEAALARAAAVLAERNEMNDLLLSTALAAREGNPLNEPTRIRRIAEAYAQALGLSPEDASLLTRAALLRDLGKLDLPNHLLLSRSLLTHDQWEQLRRYPALGAARCTATAGLEELADIIGAHQECYDGTGYPAGIEGTDIPLLARALRPVHVYNAMTSPRAYREGHATHEEACAFIQSELGKHFDPELARVFVAMPPLPKA